MTVEQFTPFTFEVEFDDPEDAEHILQGLIVAQSNNSNTFFHDIIEALNAGLQDYRAAKLLGEIKARG
jgi:hypothetical protein